MLSQPVIAGIIALGVILAMAWWNRGDDWPL